MARGLRAAAVGAAVVLAACAGTGGDPIERLQQRAWAEPWALCPGDWDAKPSCSCRNRALWLIDELRRHGHDPVAMVGYHARRPDELHMVVAVGTPRGPVVIDLDGVHPLAGYLEHWTAGPWDYDWRIAAAAAAADDRRTTTR